MFPWQTAFCEWCLYLTVLKVVWWWLALCSLNLLILLPQLPQCWEYHHGRSSATCRRQIMWWTICCAYPYTKEGCAANTKCLLVYLFIFMMCMHMHLYVYLSAVPMKVRRGCCVHWIQLELLTVLSYPMWVLGTKLWSSVGAVCPLNPQATSFGCFTWMLEIKPWSSCLSDKLYLLSHLPRHSFKVTLYRENQNLPKRITSHHQEFWAIRKG